MKVKQVPALRRKRGLRRVSGAEPQVVGLTPQTTAQRRADTMRTYILRDPKAVERQTPSPNCRVRVVKSAMALRLTPSAYRGEGRRVYFVTCMQTSRCKATATCLH